MSFATRSAVTSVSFRRKLAAITGWEESTVSGPISPTWRSAGAAVGQETFLPTDPAALRMVSTSLELDNGPFTESGPCTRSLK
jgi:hypothetical protein